MIKDIYSGDSYLYGTTQSRSPYIVDRYNDPSNGMVRYRGDHFEIYDSYNEKWTIYTGNTHTMSLSPRAETIMMWAEKKMLQEQQEAELCKKYPALKTAKDNYETIKALVQHG